MSILIWEKFCLMGNFLISVWALLFLEMGSNDKVFAWIINNRTLGQGKIRVVQASPNRRRYLIAWLTFTSAHKLEMCQKMPAHLSNYKRSWGRHGDVLGCLTTNCQTRFRSNTKSKDVPIQEEKQQRAVRQSWPNC